MLALAFPRVAWWPLAIVALAPLIHAARHATSKWEAFFLGEVSLTTAWLLSVPWVIHVMAHYGGLGLPTGIAIFIAMSLWLGIWGALFAWGVKIVQPSERFRTWLPIPLLWAATEYGRTYLLGGFAWNLLGSSTIRCAPLAMLSAAAGPYALGALLVFLSTVVAYIHSEAPLGWKVRIGTVGAVVLVMWAGAGEGMLVTRRFSVQESKEKQHRVALLQPNIRQEMRWDPREALHLFNVMMEMNDEAIATKAETIIWPESSVPLTFLGTDFYRDSVESVSRNNHVDIILGSVAEDRVDPNKIWNAAYLVSDGTTKGRYDKIRLVPFGEYVPLRKMLFFAEKLVHAVGEFQFGTNDRPLVGKNKYGPAICYEIVFPQLAMTQVRHGADVLVTVTNDAWFGPSAAPPQHLDMARMRAIETDRYLLRSGTTGISALIDPIGRVVSSLPLDTKGIVTGTFSPRHSVTPYVRFGDWFAITSVIVSLIILVLRRKGSRS